VPLLSGKVTVDPRSRGHRPRGTARKRTVADLDTAFGALGAKAAERESVPQARASEADKGKLLDRKFQEVSKRPGLAGPPRRPFDNE